MRGLLILCAALVLGALPAPAEEAQSMPAEIARIIRIAHEQGPFRSWDQLRVAMPRDVRWHLAPPEREDSRQFRRSGWIERAGQQAGVAACGSRDAPEVLTLRVSGGEQGYQYDAVIDALETQVDLRQQHHEPTMIGEIDAYDLRGRGVERVRLVRELDCPMEGSRGVRRCETRYALDLRPAGASESMTPRACRAP